MEDVRKTAQAQTRGRTNGSDGHEIPILHHALKDVQFPVQAPAVERIKDLREHKRIENKRPHNAIIMFLESRIVGMMEPEDLRAKEMEDENHSDLIDRLSQNLFDHVNGEQRIHLLVGLAMKQ
jgi:hypothetical protein